MILEQSIRYQHKETLFWKAHIKGVIKRWLLMFKLDTYSQIIHIVTQDSKETKSKSRRSKHCERNDR